MLVLRQILNLMKAKFLLLNLKCKDCADKVLHKAIEAEGIYDPKVDLQNSTISFSYQSHNALMGLSNDLTEIGFPIIEDK